MSETEERLRRSFGTVGKRYGYERVGAEFVAYRDFKVKWNRCYKWIEFYVSDYLMDAPDCVFDALAEALFSKIAGQEPRPYSQEMVDWVTRDDFAETKQPVYVRRSRNITRNPEGEFKDLRSSLRRLKEMGLVGECANPYLTWTKEELATTVGYCSTLLDTVVISSIFDSDHIPDCVLDYALYHEMLVMREGLTGFGKAPEFDMRTEELRYPEWQESERWIDRLCLHF